MTVENKEFDPETASLEELRARADQEPTEPEQKRNADGTFAPKETVEEIDEPEEKVLYQRRIDLGDGSGVQVFSADSLEELVDKLTEAQLNATKKIRELNSRVPKPQSEPKPRSADEEFAISQELMTKPTKAFQKLFQEMVGMPITDFKSKFERVEAFEKAQAWQQAQTDFVAQTPDYHAIPANGKKLTDYLRLNNLPGTIESLTKAFAELNSAGLLQVKPAAETEVTTETVVPKVQPTVRRSSGLSTRGTTPVRRPVSQGPTEEELYSMPLEKLRELDRASQGPRDPHDF